LILTISIQKFVVEQNDDKVSYLDESPLMFLNYPGQQAQNKLDNELSKNEIKTQILTEASKVL
jgi:hypothetical protein